jgi:hypothetical protein
VGAQVGQLQLTPNRACPSSPYRVDGSRLAGATPSSTPHASVARNVAPTWATTHMNLSDNSPSICDFMSLYDICVASGHAARISVSHIMGYQDVTLFCRFPTPSTSAITRKRCRRRQRHPSATIAACPPLPVIAPVLHRHRGGRARNINAW